MEGDEVESGGVAVGSGGGAGLSLNTLRPDRINYSDVSICQRVPAARLGDRDLPPDGGGEGDKWKD